MRDFLCKGWDKLYGFLGYADMRLILGYESHGKGCARIALYIRGLRPSFPTSFSSAPPPAIEISTLWEIIVRVSSASDLPRPWHLLGGLSCPHLLPLSGASGLSSRGLWIPVWFRSSSLCVDVPTVYPTLRDASRLAFCTVGNPCFLVNTRSLVSGYR